MSMLFYLRYPSRYTCACRERIHGHESRKYHSLNGTCSNLRHHVHLTLSYEWFRASNLHSRVHITLWSVISSTHPAVCSCCGSSTISLAMTGHILPLLTNHRESAYTNTAGSSGISRFLKFIKLLCGSESSKINIIHYQQYDIRLVWTIYTYCALWCLWCIIKFSREGLMKRRGPLQPLRKWTYSINSNLMVWKTLYNLTWITHISLWGLSFGYTFYLYSLFWRNQFIPTSWTLGQIISIFVWAPTVVDFLYTQYSKISTLMLPPLKSRILIYF